MSLRAVTQINILGTRGVPGRHGGFETFATHFSEFLVQQNIAVTVYCQEEGGVAKPRSWRDYWNGVQRVHFETRAKGTLATLEYDLRSTLHVLRQPGIDLVLGYNTAVLFQLQRLFRRQIAVNMDGIEWKRQKWSPAAKLWLWLNERIACTFATLKIFDHPQIAARFVERVQGAASTVICYGSDAVTEAPAQALVPFGVTENNYFISICRCEPENSVLELVQAFVAANTGLKLIVLDNLEGGNPYHDEVRAAASKDVLFPGAIYDPDTLKALRFYCRAYVHGHQVGGTNPSLVEALGAGNAVIAHANQFNRWVAGDEQLFFVDVTSCTEAFRRAAGKDLDLMSLKSASRKRHKEAFTFDLIHNRYLEEITRMVTAGRAAETRVPGGRLSVPSLNSSDNVGT